MKSVMVKLTVAERAQLSWGQDRVEQPLGEMTATKGDPVTLQCNYSTIATNAYLFWYKQLPNRSPTFILSEFTIGKGTTEDEFKERFSATLDSKSSTVRLTIKNLRVSDSAVYYCALKPTVTETYSTLIQKQN
uniref:Ig-like domain-containing protein n=1 Tax=Sinocyclocheilus grahami TaxID=75366 RepID=A0A672PD90_SINGR